MGVISVGVGSNSLSQIQGSPPVTERLKRSLPTARAF